MHYLSYGSSSLGRNKGTLLVSFIFREKNTSYYEGGIVMKMPKLDKGSLITIGGLILTGVATLVNKYSDDKKLEKTVAEEVSKQLAKK